MKHDAVLTFDLEDWFQVVGRRFGMAPGREYRGRLASQVDTILELLARHGAKATFFVLGITVEQSPEVIEKVSSSGHEIASHGYGHQLVKSLTPETFRADIDRAISVVQSVTGTRPRGYRAPEFSIDTASFWAFDVLLDSGFDYDSSIFPFRGRRYGISDFRLDAHALAAPSGRKIWELPLAVLDVQRVRLPVAGGGYWRLLPGLALSVAMRRLAERRPPVLYFHPAEFDGQWLEPTVASMKAARFALAQNIRRATIASKLDRFLSTHRTLTAREYLTQNDRSGSR